MKEKRGIYVESEGCFSCSFYESRVACHCENGPGWEAVYKAWRNGGFAVGCPMQHRFEKVQANNDADKLVDEYFATKLLKTRKLYKHPSIIDSIIDAYKLKKERNWDTLYFAFDLHGTIIEPGRLKDLTVYSDAEKVLRFLSEQSNIVLILFTSTTHEALKPFSQWCFKNKIYFKYFNENPECLNNHEGDYTSKFYYNLLFDDRAGFDPKYWGLIEEQLKIEIKNETLSISN